MIRPDGLHPSAQRWVVERTLAWLSRCRRLAKDWEASIASSEALDGRLIHQANDAPYCQARILSRALNGKQGR